MSTDPQFVATFLEGIFMMSFFGTLAALFLLGCIRGFAGAINSVVRAKARKRRQAAISRRQAEVVA